MRLGLTLVGTIVLQQRTAVHYRSTRSHSKLPATFPMPFWSRVFLLLWAHGVTATDAADNPAFMMVSGISAPEEMCLTAASGTRPSLRDGFTLVVLSNAHACTQAALTLMQQTCFWKHVLPLLRQGMAASSGFFAWKACLHALVFAGAFLRSARDCFACCPWCRRRLPNGQIASADVAKCLDAEGGAVVLKPCDGGSSWETMGNGTSSCKCPGSASRCCVSAPCFEAS